ncbi:NAD(P)-binding protein [Coniophora puteana RWD-64-598 SS2]|uniref:NAD(P)-binding protein n=1 Tax=Coniophora puteana (strain RWD-64-598) TaxID=741705 RepID=A0A5M3MUG9_CONPW|nr:NAD(P)-binding protein [Coniophora puteana RWD-64-598 SS2]EIW82690.1 NAD(P)-binding protein [Coniophora puteana RWD-64-598 SS2]
MKSVTGALSGFGLEVTKAALAHGDRVFATLRSPSALADLKTRYSSSQLCVYQLDVTQEDKIGPAFERAVSDFGRVDVVFNNAGCSVIVEAEGISDARERTQTIRGDVLECVARHAGSAIEAPPGVVHYAAANAALESLTEAYAQEVDKAWNIWFTILEPALFKTSQAKNNVFEPQASGKIHAAFCALFSAY